MRRRDDAYWMRRCLRLAVRSLGCTWPNPGVACLLVRDGVCLGAGRHQRCGGPHGEIEALGDCRRRGGDPAGATAYVSLAPCTRHGRTPPCSEALIAAGVAEVVVGVDDPSQGDAAAAFAAAGIAYRSGICHELACHLHGGFLSRLRLGRPRFTGKWAMTLDGCLACDCGQSAWISSPENLRASRRRRRVYDGILIGSGTARTDDPSLLALPPTPRTPLRIVVAGSGDLGPGQRKLLDTARVHPVLVVHDQRCPPQRRAELSAAGVHLLAVADCHDATTVATALGAHGLNEVLVEGGAVLHGHWLRAGLYDRLEVAVGAVCLGGGLPVATGPGLERIDLGQEWQTELPPRLQGETCAWRLRRRDSHSSLR